MSVATRFGSVALLVGLLAGIAPASAQSEASSSWTDPPAKGIAAPETKAAEKPAESKVTEPAPASKPAESAAAPPASTPVQSARESSSTQAATGPAIRGQRAAGLRRASIRRTASQARIASVRPRIAYDPYRKPRGSLAERMRRLARLEMLERSERRFASRPVGQRYRAYADRGGVEARDYFDRVDPYDGRAYPTMVPRRRLAGWGGLLSESRAERIAQARAAGYIVMRSRTVEYPDGRRTQSFRPLFGGNDFDDLD